MSSATSAVADRRFLLGVLAALPTLCGGYTTYIVAGGS